MKPREMDNFLDRELNDYQKAYVNIIAGNDFGVTIEKKPLLEASMSGIIKNIYSGLPVMFISAERPEWKIKTDKNGNQMFDLDNNPIFELDENENKINIASRNEQERRRKILIEKIIRSELSFIKLAGRWADTKKDNTYEPAVNEISFMVTGRHRDRKTHEYDIMDFETFKNIGIQWCKDLDQSAVIIGRADKTTLDEDSKPTIKFEMFNNHGNIITTFTKINFGSSKGIEEVHKMYMNYINDTNYGAGNTGFKKKKAKFMLSDDDERKFIKENPGVINSSSYVVDVYYGTMYVKYYNDVVNMYKSL